MIFMRAISVFALLVMSLAGPIRISRGEEVDFTRDVRPILSRHCFKCHGPDAKTREGGLRLDQADSALRGGSSGEPGIVPGKPEASEVIRRILSHDESEIMPPPTTKLPLTAEQKDILQRWVKQGGVYVPHWSFVAPRQVPLPKVSQPAWPRNAIDYFILSRLDREGLVPSPEADRDTLVRRLYLDLLGIPPSPEEAEAFLKDPSPNAYDALVDRLLKSPHYGERWARKWLDLARYADTNGYEKDRGRSMWPYRDWVINAINQDMPFDQFTIEQIAGDLLPGATLSQRIATGFHRNTMLNEEGGIDPLEFRFYAMTDRVATTGTTWLGLTMVCCQCHTHKYDPVSQREYYQVMAFLNNADEPPLDIPQPEITARRTEIEKQIQQLTDDLPNRFPLPGDYQWHTAVPVTASSAAGATLETQPDHSVRVSGTDPDNDTYTLVFETNLPRIDALRLEALADPALPSQGPGRTPHGNFVLTEWKAQIATSADGPTRPVKFSQPTADFSQESFPVAHAIDGQDRTGWAIHGPGKWNVNRTATFPIDSETKASGPIRWTIQLEQKYGTHHTLGKFRVLYGVRNTDDRPETVRRREHLEQKMNAWVDRESSRLTHWKVLRPTEARANLPILTILDDDSIFASSDQTKRDVYDLKFKTDLRGITALRIEAIPDDRLPMRGPGRVYYEGPFGNFYLTNLTLTANGQPVKFARASNSFADGRNTAATAIDDDLQSGWSVNGGQGQTHWAVFNLAEPLTETRELALQMVFEQYYACGLGRFRIWATTDPQPAEAANIPAAIEQILALPAAQRTPAQTDSLLRHFVSIAPELAAEHATIKKLREEMPAYPTTLVMSERPANEPRPTYLHKRGEFLQPVEPVSAGVPSVLPPVPANSPLNRLTFARWLVSPENPLTARVTMNRQWSILFGRGLVRTTEDFGFQGEAPSHPELLDWLAVELINQKWSMKEIHRLIVTSATYRQSSRVTPTLLAKDPQNRLLARAPRYRIDGEMVRDTALKVSGLLSPKIGGPSVFPPQPPGVTSEGTYGGLAWTVSPGEDKFRRGMYTYAKRTAPYAMFNTFDAPSGESCVARREVSNTPLQALTLMNDTVFVEASQALGRQYSQRSDSIEARVDDLFRRCLTRPPEADEKQLVLRFYEKQRERIDRKELNAEQLAGPGDGPAADRAVWTLVARAILNLDETITRH
ncbi:MAG: PSD1 domain-containing protein [Planctomycetes bacterium]|nr:PSD1 domain-containing protein [Planctomycetota bacterium]